MGRSLIGGMLANGYPQNMLCGTDVDPEQRQVTASQFNIEVIGDNTQAIQAAEVVVLAVKPQVMRDTVSQLNESLIEKKPLLISIAAGICMSDLAQWAGPWDRERFPVLTD